MMRTFSLSANIANGFAEGTQYIVTPNAQTPFHHFLKAMGGFLPSPQARWCTKKMKLDKFEEYVGDDYAVSYVGI